jgi:hypothetical protein
VDLLRLTASPAMRSNISLTNELRIALFEIPCQGGHVSRSNNISLTKG